MNKIRVLMIILVYSLCSCSGNANKNFDLPEDEFSISDNFGDGYISILPISVTTNRQDTIGLLVTQWLEHYKTQSNNPKASVIDFSIDSINVLEKPKEGIYIEVAGVQFSIIPNGIPNDFASFPGEVIDPEENWWHLTSVFGYYQIGDFYYLRILPGWGT